MFPLALFILFEPYALTISLFERALALHNFIAFASFYVQWRGLIGSQGISPAKDIMDRVKSRGWTWRNRWRDLPTLAWISCSDRALDWIQIVGMIASVSAFLGFFSGLSIAIAAVCYSSIKSLGGVFTGLQMHAHMMEIDILYVACSPFLHVTPAAFVVLASLLNFRVMMGGGSGKWFGSDQSWHNGTAMAFHYWTQPLPNPLSAWMHRMPFWMHRMETYATFVHESLCACFVFAPWYLRIIAFAGFESLMLIINLTGNYAQIGAHTMNESILLLNDDVWNAILDLGRWIPFVGWIRSFAYAVHGPHWFDLALRASPDNLSLWNTAWAAIPWCCFVLPYAFVQLIPLSGTFHGENPLHLFDPYSTKPMALWNQWLSSELYTTRVKQHWNRAWVKAMEVFLVARDFDLFGSYVKFGHMTKFRWEIIIEGSVDGLTWKEYDFKFKPSRVNKCPPFVPFHLPAMDWRLWFLPLESARGGDPPVWFMRILQRLLECSQPVMDLFESCPFNSANPPRYMRALLYDYRFRDGYEHEEDLKALVKQYSIPDTNIVSQSEAEEEQAESDIESEPEEEEEQEEEQQATAPQETEHPTEDVVAATSVPAEAPSGEGEKKTPEMAQLQESKQQRSGVKRSSGQRDVAEEVLARLARQSSRKKAPDSPNKDAHHSRGLATDEATRKALLTRQRKLIRQLLRAQLSSSSARKPMKKLVHEVPPAVDEQGQRIWWVRRHLIGPYGPILAMRPKPAAASSAPREAWEQALEGHEE